MAQLRIENQGVDPHLDPPQTAEILIGIRMPEDYALVDAVAQNPAALPTAPRALGAEIASRAIAELSQESGFLWKKSAGYQSVPRSREKALIIIGEVPIRNISRVMAHRDVVKIMPSAAALDRMDGPPLRRSPASVLGRFFSFVKRRFPFLLVLTLFLLMLSPGRVLRRLAEIFVPYH